jgi:ABC-type antimicrobial peptide transport system permease subunit
MIKYQLISSSTSITILAKDKEKVMNIFQEKKLNIQDSYEFSKNKYLKQRQESIKTTLIVSGIILIISLIEVFLMIRSSFLPRVKEIGIYRAIGVKITDIYKMFTGEIIAITTLAGIPGLILMAYILSILSGIKYLEDYIVVNPFLVMVAALFVYLFNLVIGLIPVHHTIKKRPAEILARYDLD